jgi:hypothetical protein
MGVAEHGGSSWLPPATFDTSSIWVAKPLAFYSSSYFFIYLFIFNLKKKGIIEKLIEK